MRREGPVRELYGFCLGLPLAGACADGPLAGGAPRGLSLPAKSYPSLAGGAERRVGKGWGSTGLRGARYSRYVCTAFQGLWGTTAPGSVNLKDWGLFTLGLRASLTAMHPKVHKAHLHRTYVNVPAAAQLAMMPVSLDA
eukprot:1160912-Pelagomonas_calceolata.AAC.4